MTLQRRMALSKAITLIESKSPLQMRQADLLMNHLAKKSSSESEREIDNADGQESFRIGICGPPGAGRFGTILSCLMSYTVFVPS